MALFYNNTQISTANNIYLNSQASNQVFYNNNLVWKKTFQAFPGVTWQHNTNLNDGGGGWGAESRQTDQVLVLNGGYNGSSAQCALWVDFTPWKTLTINVNDGTCSYAQFRFGVASAWTNLYGANKIKMWENNNIVSWNPVGSKSLDISDVSGGNNIVIYLYSGSTVGTNWVHINSVVLS